MTFPPFFSCFTFWLNPLSRPDTPHPSFVQLCTTTLHPKQRVALQDIKGMSVSSQKDYSFVIHLGIDTTRSPKDRGKGDLILLSSRSEGGLKK